MFWLVLLACGKDEPCKDSPCDGGDDTATGTDDSTVDDTGIGSVCHDGDKILLDSGKDPEGVHFEWSAEPRWTENGGVIPDEDAPSIVATCPACVEGTTHYTVKVDLSDDKGRGLGFGYLQVDQVCE